MVQTVKVGADAALDLSNISGDVQVTGDGGNEIRIEAIKRVRHRDAERGAPAAAAAAGRDRPGRRTHRSPHPLSAAQRGQRRAQHLGARGLRRHRPDRRRRSAVKTDFRQRRRHQGERRGPRRDRERRRHRDRHAQRRAGARPCRATSCARDIGGATNLSLSTVSGTRHRHRAEGPVARVRVGERRHRAVGRAGRAAAGQVGVGRHRVRRGARARAAATTSARIPATSASILGSADRLRARRQHLQRQRPLRFPRHVARRPASSRDRRDANRTIRGAYGDASAILSIKTFSGTVVISRK